MISNVMPGCSEELILQTPGFLILFDEPDGCGERASACFQEAIAFFGSRRAAIPAIMRRMIGIPPDARVHAPFSEGFKTFQWHTLRLRWRLFHGNQFGADRQHHTGLFLARVAVHGRLPLGINSRFILRQQRRIGHVDHVIPLLVELRLCKETDEMPVPAMRADQDDLAQAIAAISRQTLSSSRRIRSGSRATVPG